MDLERKKNLSYRFQQGVILLLHFVLLYWIYFVLSGMGNFPVSKVLLHFIGIGVFGAGLIYGCAVWAKYHYRRENAGE